eukprot:TRINITY_DN7696_c0_g1_i1.p1 TRINITY_DN7696_c0_g1~~TRINITY_DN7696_c0_g1_i1.p1  ORF type:complete len:258 (-),score=21.23 TRINITY_DN7696_c0_g1_i1:52-825(-)
MDQLWEKRNTYVYYTEFIAETAVLIATLGHYLHIYYLHGISLTLIDVVLFLHMRHTFSNLLRKIANHRHYLCMSRDMNDHYPTLNEQELSKCDDNCPICLMRMANNAKKLPCGHIFHAPCLRSWLEHQHSCPTCRYSLLSAREATNVTSGVSATSPGSSSVSSTISSVLRGLLGLNTVPQTQHPSATPSGQQRHSEDIPELVRSICNAFPNIPPAIVQQDLNETHSMDQTIERILQGRLSSPVDQQPSAVVMNHEKS